MIYPPELLDRLQAITPAPWSGRAFRHMFGDYPPDAENTRGARWNPPGVAAVHWLKRDGLLLPSARSPSTNLVIFPANRPANARFEIISAETVAP